MKIQKNIIFLLYSTLFFVIIWIISSIYHIFSTSTISPDLQLIVQPIPDSFSQSVIHLVQEKKQVTPIYSIANTIASTSANLSPVLPIPPTSSTLLNDLNTVEKNATASSNQTPNSAPIVITPSGPLP